MISASAFDSADNSYFDLDYPRYQKSLIQWLFIMPSFIYFGVQARGNGGIKGSHSNSTRNKWSCVFRTLLGMSTFDWNLSEILLSKTTKLFVCSSHKWPEKLRRSKEICLPYILPEKVPHPLSNDLAFLLFFVTLLLLKCWCGWHWFCCYTVPVRACCYLFAGLGRGHKTSKQTFMVQW